MKRIFALTLALALLLCGCGGKEKPTETTTNVPQESIPATQETENGGEGEGILDPTTEIRYLIVKKIVTNDAGQELWGTEYTYDDTGFCTHEREYSNIGTASYSRTNSPDALNRIASSLYTQLDGSQYTVTYTYDDFDRCIREDIRYEDGTEEYTEYTYNDKAQYLTLKQYIGGELIMDYAFSYTYDGNGNQVSMDEYLDGDLLYHVTFTYDAQGREVSSTTSLVNGEVQSRTESHWDGLTETRYFYSGEETDAFMVSVFTYDDNGNVVFEETRQGETVINRAEYIYEPFEVKK
ncbi:MAG: hypothetical protein IKK72_00050 [Oscillospiraceae bacterium]|nr:hypothetical protein [Oscillospiraceae bacterium]